MLGICPNETRHYQPGNNTSIQVLLSDLKACSKTRNLDWGKQLHAEAVKCRHDSDIYVSSALSSMYAKCGSMIEAHQVFDGIKNPDVVSWTALILGYTENGQGLTALDLFERMQSEGLAPNSVTIVAALKACGSLASKGKANECRNRGRKIYELAVKIGCGTDIYVQNTLVDIYSKCGSMDDALQVFESIQLPNVVSWNVLIQGYADNGQGRIALDLFSRMRNGAAPQSVTFIAALKACTSIAVKEGRESSRGRGKQLHNLVVENSCHSDIYVQNTLIDMYANCGIMNAAQHVFNSIQNPTAVSWNALILGYAENGEESKVFNLFTRIKNEGRVLNSVTFVAALKACISLTVTEEANGQAECRDRGKEIHDLAITKGWDSNIYVQNTLIDMYSKCSSMLEAREVFDSMKYPDVVSFNALISGYANNGQGFTALELFTKMRIEGCPVDSMTLVAVLKACTSLALEGASERVKSLARGKNVYNLALDSGYGSNVYVQSTLIDMYSKCCSMHNARMVFDIMQNPNVVSWNTLILGYADNAQGISALDLFARMKREGPAPNSVTLVAALKACISLAAEGSCEWEECRNYGKELHKIAMENGCGSNSYVQSTLINLYAKCGCMVEARGVFDSMHHPNVVAWTALCLGYAENGQGVTVLELFTRMRREGPAPSPKTLVAALKACTMLGALEFGRTVHSEITAGNHIDMVLVTCLVDFYAKCGSLVEAQSVFEMNVETRDVITWTALMAGFTNCGDCKAVFGLFQKMQDAGFQADSVSFVCILACCKHAGLLEKGKEFFDAMSPKYGISPTVEHYNCMLDILGLGNKLDDAMALMQRMACSPNAVTWTTILGACRKWKNVEIGRHAFQSLMKFNDRDAACTLMGQVYGSRGMWQEQEMVMDLRNMGDHYLSC